ncbi:MAG: hypothetical protein M1831_000121 [Alyxoria varia]|nr:MAG: hypothetical protein M1831_000121 [Alyxoria varia]
MAGRGGAGNIEEANRRISKQLEQSQSIAESGIEESPIAQAFEHDRQEQKHVHYGRGGAGNSGKLVTGNSLSDTQETPISASENERKDSQGILYGRGGAGNFRQGGDGPAAGNEPLTGKPDIENLRDQAKRDAYIGLAKPEKAYLAGKDRDARRGAAGTIVDEPIPQEPESSQNHL